MPRAARLVIPGLAHHITHRGNRRQPLFFNDEDRHTYLSILRNALRKSETRCLGWCLMDNHVHLILLPVTADGLRAPLASVHTTYSQHINRAQNVSGHLFQGRYASYPMDDAHLMVAIRYVENNPVKAGLVAHAEAWPWSSARAHISGQSDGLTDIAALGQHVANWRAMLSAGLEASDRVERALATGQPLAKQAWLEASGIIQETRPRGRPPRFNK